MLGRYVRWRIGWGPLTFALLFPSVLTLLAAAVNIAAGAVRPAASQLAAWPDLIPKFLFILLFVGVGEETGWRGFALPELQKRHSPVVASLVLGAIWAAWHIPRFGVEFAPAEIPWFVLSVLAGALTATWLFNFAHGSLLPLPLFHAMVNTVGAGFVFPMFKGADAIRLWWIYAGLWALAALDLRCFPST